MRIRRAVKLFSLMCSVAMACLMVPHGLAASASTAEMETVKVFFPLQQGFAEVDENGDYSGYTYEYLMRVAQLTGWKYEFLPVEMSNESLLAGLEQVKNGELDLAGVMNYSEGLAAQYEYSVPYGETSFALVALEDNAKLNSRTFVDYTNLRIALVESADGQNTLLNKYCQENGIVYEPVYAKSNSECRKLLNEGLADASISKDISGNKDLKIIAKFSPMPFYFAASKGNTELVKKLNSALRAIDASDPAFQDSLHEKYFPADLGLNLPLTESEIEYLKSKPTVRVAILEDRAPIQDYDPNTGEFSGILVDILDIISQRSGLEFELINVDSQSRLREEIDDGLYDVVAGMPYYYGRNAASGTVSRFLLTPPVFSSPVVRINSIQGHDSEENKEVLVAESLKDVHIPGEILYSSNIEEMFRLVNSGTYSEAYVNGYMAQYWAKTGNYPNVTLSFMPNGNNELCLGVYRKLDLNLVSVLTQAIATITDVEIADIVYRNTNQPVVDDLWSIIRRDPAQVAAPVFLVLMVVLGLLTLLFLKTKRLNKLISQEKNTYKEISQIDRLSQTYNNTEFKHLANEFLSQTETKITGALIICDIDDFKKINDTFGHLKGDQVIQKIGHLLTSTFSSRDVVGRLGGDEFAILVKDVPDNEMVENYCAEVKEKSRSLIPESAITLSVGVAVFSGNVSFDTLFKQADAVLYDVKNSGKDSYKLCSVEVPVD